MPGKTPVPEPAALGGTVDVTNGSTTVTGTGTSFTSDFAVGDGFFVIGDSQQYVVASITNDTSLELTANYAGTTQSGVNYTRSNFTDVFARFGGLAIGSGGTPASATQTGLESEHSADGLARKHGTTTTPSDEVRDGVYTWVSTKAGAGGRTIYVSNLSAAWEYTGGGTATVREVAPVNDPDPFQGVAAARQVFAADWILETNDIVRFTHSTEHDGSFTAGGGGSAGGALTNIGLLELARLFLDETTDRIGYESDPPYTINSGDWIDENESAATIGNPLKFDVMAIGSAVTAVSESDESLGTELTSGDDAGAPRKSGADIIGELMTPPGSDEDFDTAAVFNNFEGDTVQWRPDVVNDKYWEVQGSGWDYGEVGVFNGDATKDVMLIRATRGATVPFDAVGDRLIPVVRMLSQ